jgi:hypothetical protein
MMLRGCYKATVNESETITEAQPFCAVRRREVARLWFRVSGQRHQRPIERS